MIIIQSADLKIIKLKMKNGSSSKTQKTTNYSNTPLTNLQIIFANQQNLLNNTYKKSLGYVSQSKFNSNSHHKELTSTADFSKFIRKTAHSMQGRSKKRDKPNKTESKQTAVSVISLIKRSFIKGKNYQFDLDSYGNTNNIDVSKEINYHSASRIKSTTRPASKIVPPNCFDPKSTVPATYSAHKPSKSLREDADDFIDKSHEMSENKDYSASMNSSIVDSNSKSKQKRQAIKISHNLNNDISNIYIHKRMKSHSQISTLKQEHNLPNKNFEDLGIFSSLYKIHESSEGKLSLKSRPSSSNIHIPGRINLYGDRSAKK